MRKEARGSVTNVQGSLPKLRAFHTKARESRTKAQGSLSKL